MRLPVVLYLFFTAFLMNGCDLNSIINIEGIAPVDISCFLTESNELVIDDQLTYETLFTDSLCAGYTPPNIDFNERTLLGLRTEATGCTAFYTRSVHADTHDKQYVYKVRVHVGVTGCDTLKQLVNYNWVTVPKLPDKYEALFEVTYK